MCIRLSAGFNYDLNDKIRLRAGVAWDEEAIRGPSTRTGRVPGNDRTWLSAGFGYQLSDRFSFDFGYTHIFVSDADIDNTNLETVGGSALRGTVETNVDILGAQLNWTFK